jgi:type I restriction enzyme R subunit
MTRITENTIEEFAIELLERLGYQYIYAPDIAHDGKVKIVENDELKMANYER